MGVVATQIRKGQCIRYNGEDGIIQSLEHRTPGKGNALIAVTIRSLQSGKTKTIRFASKEKVEIIHTLRKKVEFSYSDASGFHFMDENYEMLTISEEMISAYKDYLIEGSEAEMLLLEDNIVSIELPKTVKLKVVNSSEGIKGNTANNPTKPATLETGKTIQVPLFIKENDLVIISTENGEYAGRSSS